MKQFIHAVYIIFTLILVSVLVKVYPLNIEEMLELRYVTIFWIMITIPYGIWLKFSPDKPMKKKSPTDQ